MAAKVALAALISLGLLVVAIATAHVLLAESTASAAASTCGAASASVAADCACSSGDAVGCEGAERRGHLAWNAASWLVGLGLVLAVGRRSRAQRAD